LLVTLITAFTGDGRTNDKATPSERPGGGGPGRLSTPRSHTPTGNAGELHFGAKDRPRQSEVFDRGSGGGPRCAGRAIPLEPPDF
jgi:hypothetical protein